MCYSTCRYISVLVFMCGTVLGRNRTLFRCVLRSHYRVRSAVTQYFRYRRGSYALCKLMNTWHVYTARMGPTPNGSSALQRFERGNTLEKCNGIMFDFNLGLPRVCFLPNKTSTPSERRQWGGVAMCYHGTNRESVDSNHLWIVTHVVCSIRCIMYGSHHLSNRF